MGEAPPALKYAKQECASDLKYLYPGMHLTQGYEGFFVSHGSCPHTPYIPQP